MDHHEGDNLAHFYPMLNDTMHYSEEQSDEEHSKLPSHSTYEDHPYVADMAEAGPDECTSRRTAQTPFNVNAATVPVVRDAYTVDEKHLLRSGKHLSEVLRPLDCFIGCAEYKAAARVAAESIADLSVLAAHFGAIKTKMAEFDGVHISLPWPQGKTLRLTSGDRIGFPMHALDALQCNFPQCGLRLEVLGVVVGQGESMLRDHRRPIIMLSSNGCVYAYVPPLPIWNEDYDNADNGERMFLVAESLHLFAKEGLIRCDFSYTEEGGAPFCCPENLNNVALKEIVTHKGKARTGALLCILQKYQGHYFFINGCPGMLKDRIWIISHEAPQYVSDSLYTRSNGLLSLIGRIALTPDDPICEADFYVTLCRSGKIYGYEPSTGAIYLLAENIDMFLRMGTRRWHFNFRVPSNKGPFLLEPPTFRPTPESGFSLIPKELLMVRIRAVVSKCSSEKS